MTESITVVIISVLSKLAHSSLPTINYSQKSQFFYVEIEKSVVKFSWIRWSIIAEDCDTSL